MLLETRPLRVRAQQTLLVPKTPSNRHRHLELIIHARRLFLEKRQSEMMKQRWARNRPEMLLKVIEKARQANLTAGQRKRRFLLAR